MSWQLYLYNAVVAAVVGAGTNQLAIMAILRHILPRKKGEIARRIQRIVADELLSPEKMRDKMDNPRVGELLRDDIDATLESFLRRDLPSPDDLLADHVHELDAAQARLRDALLREYRARVSDPAFASGGIRPFLEERWTALGERTPRSLLSNADALAGFVGAWLADLCHSPALRHSLERTLEQWLADLAESGGSVGDLLPSGVAGAAEKLAEAQARTLADGIADAARTPAINNAIAKAIMTAVSDRLSGQGVLGGIKGAVANFMGLERDVRGVARRLPETLREVLNRPESLAGFAGMLRTSVRGALEQGLPAELRDPDSRRRRVNRVLDAALTEESFSAVGRRTAEALSRAFDRTMNESLERMGLTESGDAILDEATERCRRILSSSATADFLAGQFDEAATAWRAHPLGRLERYVSVGARRDLSAAAAEEARLMLRERLLEFASQAGVWDVITESIEEYDDAMLANLVTQLAKKELHWVTVLGGVIGFAAGLVQTAMRQWW